MKSSGINDAMGFGARRMLGFLRQVNLRVGWGKWQTKRLSPPMAFVYFFGRKQ